MGFGTLFIGYVLAFFMSLVLYGYYIEFVGILLMLYAAIKLSEYEEKFRYLIFSTIFLLLISCYSVFSNTASEIFQWEPAFFSNFSGTYEMLKIGADAIFHAALFTAVGRIAHDTGCLKISGAAIRNALFYCIYFIARMITRIPAISASAAAKYINIAGNYIWLLCVVINSVMLFSCYMKICDEGDTEMEAKPSRFKIINKMREDFDQKESKARKADAEFIRQKSSKKKKKK